MKQKWKRLIFFINESGKRKKNAYFGTSLYDEIKVNPLPTLFLISISSLVIIILGLKIHLLSDFLYWFVGILEITKVLKIPFLDNLKYYEYLSIFVYFYITLSLLWDLASLLSRLNVRIYLIRDDVWMIQKRGFGNKLTKFKINPSVIQLDWHHSGSLDILGLNRIYWKKENLVIGFTPFFFPYGKNKEILDKILSR